MKIRIYCEGKTEQGLKELLTPIREELQVKGLGVIIGSYHGNTKLLKKIGRATKEAISEGCPAVFCITDLYNVHIAFTKELRNALGNRNWLSMEVSEQVDWLKTHITTQCVSKEYHNKFYPHIAVHDIEALMFADQDKIKHRLKVVSIGRFPSPECIDHNNPPTKQLNELFRTHLKRKYKKTTDGINLLRSIDFALVYDKCTYFAAFVDDLRSIEPQ